MYGIDFSVFEPNDQNEEGSSELSQGIKRTHDNVLLRRRRTQLQKEASETSQTPASFATSTDEHVLSVEKDFSHAATLDTTETTPASSTTIGTAPLDTAKESDSDQTIKITHNVIISFLT